MIRAATDADASALVSLIAQLGFYVDEDGVAARLSALLDLGEPILVAEVDGDVAGCLDWHVMTTIHRPGKVGRLVMLVVDEPHRGKGLGTALIGEAERRMKAAGCELVEVTSNLQLEAAHRYYESLGFVETSRRFGKEL